VPDSPGAVVQRLASLGLTLATGESVTAGLVAATLADVPGCSAVLRGGVVAYQVDVKGTLLGVPEAALADGIVSRSVAVAMAAGAARALRADVGVGTTGVAGPDPHDGQPVGTVWVAVSAPGGVWATGLGLAGDRAQIRRQTVEACWALVLDAVGR
jgi:nicotinamide-nucleotide amidase